MEHLHHFQYGLLTPVLAYAMACVAAGLGLRCTLRATEATGAAKRNWLVTAATAIGAGIWTMHFIAMLGFGVDGSPIRYDLPLTVLSLVVAIGVVSAGVVTVGYSRARLPALLLGGVGTGLGIAAMHYIGMAAMSVHGVVEYGLTLVVLSVLVAVAAATAALWAAFAVRGLAGTVVAALVMGVAVTAMHYTAMAALQVDVVPSSVALPGATAMEFVFPLIVALGSFLFLSSAFVALSPTEQERAAAADAERLRGTAIPIQ
jgi:NO-binding membrane sensor protein with MHYT domain